MYFISYSSKDKDQAEQVVDYLEKSGIDCWIAPRNIDPGFSYPSQIVKAIRECEGFILITSDHVNSSNHVNSEVSRAFDQKKRIYPLFIENVKFSDAFIYYLGTIQWINAYSNFKAGLKELVGAIESNLNSKEASLNPASQLKKPKPVSEHKAVPESSAVRIASYDDLVASGYTALDIAMRLVENDYKLYPGMPVENEGSPEQWAGYLSTYPETFRYLINSKNEIIGNWSFLAVSEELHEKKLAAGELLEQSFSLDETEYLLFPGDYIGYLLNLSINDGYNNMKNLNLLLSAFADQILTFAKAGIFFKSWYVNVFRKDHEAMYRKLGFKYLMDNKSFGKLYYLNCQPSGNSIEQKKESENPIIRMNNKLMEIYCEHYM